MHADEVLAAFAARLRQRGIAVSEERVGAGRHARAAWDAFAELTGEPAYEAFEHPAGAVAHVDQALDGDLLLFETAYRAGEVLVGEFTRQFTLLDADAEYIAMHGLVFAVQAEPDAALAPLAGVQTWGCGGPPFTDAEWARREEPPRPFRAAAEWREQVEASPAFRALLGDRVPARFSFGPISA